MYRCVGKGIIRKGLKEGILRVITEEGLLGSIIIREAVSVFKRIGDLADRGQAKRASLIDGFMSPIMFEKKLFFYLTLCYS